MKLSEKFRSVTPKRTERQLEERKELLMKFGAMFPFITYNGVLVDDYDNYDICCKNNIPFKVLENSFSSESAAIANLICRQLNTGGLTSFQRCEILLRNAQVLKNTIGWDREKLAEIAGVSKTIFEMAGDVVRFADDKLLDRARDEKISIEEAYDEVMIKVGEVDELKSDLMGLIETIDSFYGVPKIVFPTLQKIAKKYD